MDEQTCGYYHANRTKRCVWEGTQLTVSGMVCILTEILASLSKSMSTAFWNRKRNTTENGSNQRQTDRQRQTTHIGI